MNECRPKITGSRVIFKSLRLWLQILWKVNLQLALGSHGFCFHKIHHYLKELKKCAMPVSVLSQPTLAFGILVCFRAFLDSPVAEFETLIHAGAVCVGTCRAERYQWKILSCSGQGQWLLSRYLHLAIIRELSCVAISGRRTWDVNAE